MKSIVAKTRLHQLLSILGLVPRRTVAVNLLALCNALLSRQGEASGTLLAKEFLELYEASTRSEQLGFWREFPGRCSPDPARLDAAIAAYRASPGPSTISEIHAASESRMQQLIRLLNLAPNGTSKLLQLRLDVLEARKTIPALAAVDGDFSHVFSSWFNAGFLDLQRIDWRSPALVLHRIIQYEAVHSIKSWEDLRARVEPADRRCYAFFHPRIPDDPLIFIEVALTAGVPVAIDDILTADRAPIAVETATTATFYSISSCQKGLRGIPFGNFLIKRVADLLRTELPHLKDFVTLSPVPGFVKWLEHRENRMPSADSPELAALAASYLVTAKSSDGQVLDPVARFHLGNGARLENIRTQADSSPKGLKESLGVMVNYRYDMQSVEPNYIGLIEHGEVAASKAVCELVRTPSRKPAIRQVA